MAGAAKRRQAKERQTKPESSDDKTSSSGAQAPESPSQHPSPPRVDGNRDPAEPRDRVASTSGPTAQVVAYRNKNLDLGAAAAFLCDGVSLHLRNPFSHIFSYSHPASE